MQTKLLSILTKYYMVTTISGGSYNIYKNYNSNSNTDDNISSSVLHGIIGAGMGPSIPITYAIDKYNSIKSKKLE